MRQDKELGALVQTISVSGGQDSIPFTGKPRFISPWKIQMATVAVGAVVGVQLPQTFPVSLFRPCHGDGAAGSAGANLGMVQALLRTEWPADVYCSKPARKVNQILCTG